MREKLQIAVSGRLPQSKFELLEKWRVHALLGRTRSDVIGRLLERIIDLLLRHNALGESLESVVQRLNLSPA